MNNFKENQIKKTLNLSLSKTKNILLPQTPRCNVFRMNRTSPSPILQTNRKLQYSGGLYQLPRLINQKLRLRNVLFRSQPYRSLFSKLPTVCISIIYHRLRDCTHLFVYSTDIIFKIVL